MGFKEQDWWLGTDHRHTKFECWLPYLQHVDIWLHCLPFPWQRLHLCPSLLLPPHPSVWCIIHYRAIKERSPFIRTVQQCHEWKALLYCASRVHSELRNVHIRCLFFMCVSELDKHMQKLATNGGFRIKSLVWKLVIAGLWPSVKSSILCCAPPTVNIQSWATDAAVGLSPNTSHALLK